MRLLLLGLILSSTSAVCISSTEIPSSIKKWVSEFSESKDIFDTLHGITDTKATRKYRSVTDDPGPTNDQVLRIEYTKGSRGGKSGLSMYGDVPLDLKSAKTVKFCFNVFFPDDFDFFFMGKLPGLFAFDESKSPANCQDIFGQKCWSTRFMWRENGDGEIYPSLDHESQDSNYMENPKQFGTGPGGLGDSLGRGNFKFSKGEWTSVCQEISINKRYIKVTVNNNKTPVIHKKNIDFQGFPFRGIQYASFFGGSSKYASPKDQYAYFKRFSVEILG
jgi:hypothetical protein